MSAYKNTLRISVYQEDKMLCEKVFFAPVTSQVDVRPILPEFIRKLQRTLSKKEYQTSLSFGNNPNETYDFLDYHQKMINLYPEEWRSEMYPNPEFKELNFDEIVIRGVECKFGLYVDNKPITERIFYVNYYNKDCAYSLDIINAVDEISFDVCELLKANDVEMLWKTSY